MLQGWLLSAASAEAVYNLPLPSALCPLPCAMCQGRRGPRSLPQAQQHRGQQPSCN